MKIIAYTAELAIEIADLFHQSVHGIDPSIYTVEQQEAWAPTPPNYVAWTERLNAKRPFVAIIDERIAGFIELEADGHIDCAYTHPNFQGIGVASALYDRLVREARNKNIKRLYVEASLLAMPFFAHRGFAAIKKNTLKRNGVDVVNFSMEKLLETKCVRGA